MKAFLERNKVCGYPFLDILLYMSFRRNLFTRLWLCIRIMVRWGDNDWSEKESNKVQCTLSSKQQFGCVLGCLYFYSYADSYSVSFIWCSSSIYQLNIHFSLQLTINHVFCDSRAPCSITSLSAIFPI
jgi:hypothetical protein